MIMTVISASIPDESSQQIVCHAATAAPASKKSKPNHQGSLRVRIAEPFRSGFDNSSSRSESGVFTEQTRTCSFLLKPRLGSAPGISSGSQKQGHEISSE
jgi:hypothetical protein